MRTRKILKQIKDFLKRHWQKWTILAIIGMIIYISFIFYVYVYKPVYQPRELVPEKLEINEKVYQEIMDFDNQRQEKINQIINKDYPDVFR